MPREQFERFSRCCFVFRMNDSSEFSAETNQSINQINDSHSRSQSGPCSDCDGGNPSLVPLVQMLTILLQIPHRVQFVG